ncbi:hypothetical protein GCM10023166_24810 [Paeniglutamicibacter cryotolerans]|uniref:Uncharacterized protein n=1 Tax=Paeniglutamicibacter cryotolerans TaxID=670079 RepID=A0A839QHW8_9MICC|nr:hypothetical protein [Paeniglutamicibacter cryotolerans]
MLRREEGGRFSQELVIFPQIGDLATQAFEFSAFILIQGPGWFAAEPAPVLFNPDPGAQGLIADIDFAGDFRDGASGVDDQGRGFSFVFVGESPALLLCF